MTILVIAEHDNNTLQAATLNTVTAATKLNQHIDILVMGNDCKKAAEAAAGISGINRVLLCESENCEHLTAEQLSEQVMALADGYGYFLASATTFGKNFMPRIAAKLGVAQISDIIEVISEDTFKRPIYAGNAIATVKSSDAKKVITVRGTAFDLASCSGNAVVENITCAATFDKTIFVNHELTKSARPELTSAKIIISGGRGMQNGDNFKMLDEIADKLGAAVGASRAAVDAGFVPNDYQVGQTGKIVAPDLYIAVGISGAIQHLAGMKDSKVIVAINKDEDAPIFQVADYGLVMDLFDALPQLNAELG